MERDYVDSSNLAEVGYENGILEVVFKDGSVYQYNGVPQQVHEGLMAASSHGKYLDQFVKKAGYHYQRIT